MNYKCLKNLGAKKFKRFTGIKRKTFDRMFEILTLAKPLKRSTRGRKSKLCLQDQLLVALEYWREYRTYFHIGTSFGISEGTVCKIVRWVEEVLIKSNTFRLPGRKAMLTEKIECILIDATECSVERPKKNRRNAILERKKDTL
jgi:hypothetical protein